jgi:peptidoglycan/xylan/chitin deacetylase (PgdA/CDA1 family)
LRVRDTARQLVPGALYGAPLRWTMPELSGRSPTHHIGLTLDDGPDPTSSPAILDTLASYDVRATFFVVGEHAVQHRQLVRSMHQGGHEIAVHGWTHRCVLRVPPDRLLRETWRTADVIADITGERPRWYRPPYGLASLASNAAAREVGLTPVLWTAWGRDWSRWVTPAGIVRRVRLTLRPGGTVLLHDTDRYAAPGSWRNTDRALGHLLRGWEQRGVPVGPLCEHWPSAYSTQAAIELPRDRR